MPRSLVRIQPGPPVALVAQLAEHLPCKQEVVSSSLTGSTMNIFYVDKDPKIAAQSLCDKHVVKMILESAQMLSTAQNAAGLPGPYKSTHFHHPSNVWVRKSPYNYAWLLRHFHVLCEEYTYRYGKRHKCEDLLTCFLSFPHPFESTECTDPPLCMPDEYKIGDAVTSYREYYRKGKAHLLKYTKREKPEWLNDASQKDKV